MSTPAGYHSASLSPMINSVNHGNLSLAGSGDDDVSFGTFNRFQLSLTAGKTGEHATSGTISPLVINQAKLKRSRQRVDAGEPRNTYSSSSSLSNSALVVSNAGQQQQQPKPSPANSVDGSLVSPGDRNSSPVLDRSTSPPLEPESIVNPNFWRANHQYQVYVQNLLRLHQQQIANVVGVASCDEGRSSEPVLRRRKSSTSDKIDDLEEEKEVGGNSVGNIEQSVAVSSPEPEPEPEPKQSSMSDQGTPKSRRKLYQPQQKLQNGCTGVDENMNGDGHNQVVVVDQPEKQDATETVKSTPISVKHGGKESFSVSNIIGSQAKAQINGTTRNNLPIQNNTSPTSASLVDSLARSLKSELISTVNETVDKIITKYLVQQAALLESHQNQSMAYFRSAMAPTMAFHHQNPARYCFPSSATNSLVFPYYYPPSGGSVPYSTSAAGQGHVTSNSNPLLAHHHHGGDETAQRAMLVAAAGFQNNPFMRSIFPPNLVHNNVTGTTTSFPAEPRLKSPPSYPGHHFAKLGRFLDSTPSAEHHQQQPESDELLLASSATTNQLRRKRNKVTDCRGNSNLSMVGTNSSSKLNLKRTKFSLDDMVDGDELALGNLAQHCLPTMVPPVNSAGGQAMINSNNKAPSFNMQNMASNFLRSVASYPASSFLQPPPSHMMMTSNSVGAATNDSDELCDHSDGNNSEMTPYDPNVAQT